MRFVPKTFLSRICYDVTCSNWTSRVQCSTFRAVFRSQFLTKSSPFLIHSSFLPSLLHSSPRANAYHLLPTCSTSWCLTQGAILSSISPCSLTRHVSLLPPLPSLSLPSLPLSPSSPLSPLHPLPPSSLISSPYRSHSVSLTLPLALRASLDLPPSPFASPAPSSYWWGGFFVLLAPLPGSLCSLCTTHTHLKRSPTSMPAQLRKQIRYVQQYFMFLLNSDIDPLSGPWHATLGAPSTRTLDDVPEAHAHTGCIVHFEGLTHVTRVCVRGSNAQAFEGPMPMHSRVQRPHVRRSNAHVFRRSMPTCLSVQCTRVLAFNAHIAKSYFHSMLSLADSFQQ